MTAEWRNALYLSSGRSGAQAMSSGKHQEIWLEQCEAARTIMLRYGLKAAFDYAVGEKLMNFAEAGT